MTFKTTLYKALEASTSITLDGYEVDDDMLVYTVPKYLHVDHPNNNKPLYSFDLSSYDRGEYTIFDCEVEIDDDGYCEVLDDEGCTHGIELRVSRAITEEDL